MHPCFKSIRGGLLLTLAATSLTTNPGFSQAASVPGQGTMAVVPMAAGAHPAFAVAVVRPHDPASSRQGFNATGEHFVIRNQTVSSLMMYAYGVHPRQIVDAPDWLSKDRYDIDGKTDTEGEPNLRQQQEMVAKLLADRFHLHFHRDTRVLAVYAIRVAKDGPKLAPAANPDAQADQEANGHGTEVSVLFTSATLSDFVLGMQFFLDRPLLDRTGLTGRYDFSVRYTHDEARSTHPAAPPGIFTAIQDQLGLKLDATKAPTGVLVIEGCERPSEN